MSTDMLIYGVALLVGLAVLLLGVGLMALQRKTSVQTRLNQFLATGEGRAVTSADVELAVPFTRRVIFPIARRSIGLLSWMWPKYRMAEMRNRLAMAGHPYGLTTSDFVGLKGWSMLIMAGLTLLVVKLAAYPLTTTTVLMVVLLIIISYFLPDVWLSRQIRLRQESITKQLPDALDMLVVGMEAGLSFENALIEVIGRWRNALTLELMRVQRDTGMGVPRRQALQGLNERTGVPDVALFVSAVNQAEELGVSITKVLEVQAEELRIRRRQRAQEAANKMPIKMLFPMVFLIFPAIFAVLLGPGLPDLFRGLGG